MAGGGWHHDNANWRPKQCAVCSTTFIPKSGVHKFCSEGCKGKWKYITGIVTTSSQYESISGSWERYLSRLLYSGGDKRKSLSREDLMSILKRQDYKCALSGVPLTCNLEVGVKFPHNASVDRIKAGGPYVKDNVQLVCRSLNHWRADTDLQDFIDMCHAVSEFQKAKEESEGKDGC